MTKPPTGPSPVLVVCVTVVAVCTLASVTLILLTANKSEIPEAWLGIFAALVGTLVTALVNLGRTDKIGRQVADLSNGRMDAKLRAAFADVLQDHLIDPKARPQIELDRVERDQHR